MCQYGLFFIHYIFYLFYYRSLASGFPTPIYTYGRCRGQPVNDLSLNCTVA
jgi:hypothetical protein